MVPINIKNPHISPNHVHNSLRKHHVHHESRTSTYPCTHTQRSTPILRPVTTTTQTESTTLSALNPYRCTNCQRKMCMQVSCATQKEKQTEKDMEDVGGGRTHRVGAGEETLPVSA